MIDFQKARKEAFSRVSQTRVVEKDSKIMKGKFGTSTMELWRVFVEVPHNDNIRDFALEITLKSDFPLSLPVITLTKEDYDEIKYLPHVDSKGIICLYDEEYVKQNTEDPAGIVNECINQAVRILKDGLNKDCATDFNDEIIAYWENTYHQNDSIVEGYLGSGMSTILPGVIEVFHLLKPHANVSLFIGNNELEIDKIKDFFGRRTLETVDGFFLGTIKENISPPFYFQNQTLISFIKDHFEEVWQEIKSYLNRNVHKMKLLIFSVLTGDKYVFFGFYLSAFSTNHKGWRSNQTAIMVMTDIAPLKSVSRIRFTEFHPQRFRARTNGQAQISSSKKIMLAGLGSIGSNLLFYLNSLEISSYYLVDPDVLKIENINRHLLSFKEVGMTKVEAIAQYLKLKDPFVDIKKYRGSLANLIQDDLGTINDLDLIFCAIGKDAIETFLLENLALGKIEKPVMLFWVEPYLLGAHVLYVRPETSFKLRDLEVDSFYKFNVISNETYNSPIQKLTLREAGCQGSYMPYGKAEIAQFFAALIPHLYKIIDNPPDRNLAITYVGNIEIATKFDILISRFAETSNSRQIIIKEI